jgi:hypothetical protein
VPDSTLVGIGLVILGVLLILIGASMIAGSLDKIQAAQDFNDRNCTTDFYTGQRSCPDNPYVEGSSGLFWGGLAGIVVGSIILYVGTR